MGRVLTNNVQLSYAVESSPGTLPGSPTWRKLEPNAIKKFGAEIKTVAREPISNIRQRRKGTVTDLDSSVEFDSDLTMETFRDFIEGFCYSAFKGTNPFSPSAVTSSVYTVASGGALAQNTLIYARGFANSANNGLKVVGTGSTSTSIPTTGLAAEASPPSNAIVEVCGFRATSGDITVDSNGNLTSTTLDFTTLGLTVGQSIWVGGDATANSFATAADRGYARIDAISAHLLTLSKRSQSFAADTGTGKLIDIYFGQFARNVGADSSDYAEKTFTFELTYPNLQDPGPGDMYEYAIGNYSSSLVFDLPLTNKATTSFTFVGTDTPNPTTTRDSGASTPISVLKGTAFSTSSDVARLRITQVDETGLTTDFKTLKVTLNNNASGEKTVAQLGPKFINVGRLDVDIEADLVFTDSAVIDAIRANTTVTMDFAMRNEDGAILVDIPSMTLGSPNREFPVNQSVLLKTSAMAFIDETLGTSVGITVFSYVPVA